MNTQYGRLVDIITAQQAGHENKPRFTIGEQLKDMAREDEHVTELLIADLEKKELSLEAAEKMLDDYAKKNRKGANVFCITPTVADTLLRDMYGLPEEHHEPQKNDVIDLNNFL